MSNSKIANQRIKKQSRRRLLALLTTAEKRANDVSMLLMACLSSVGGKVTVKDETVRNVGSVLTHLAVVVFTEGVEGESCVAVVDTRQIEQYHEPEVAAPPTPAVSLIHLTDEESNVGNI